VERNKKGQYRKAVTQNAMDVDTAASRSPLLKPARGRPKIRCFFCDNEGHMKKDCRKFKALQRREEVHSHRKLKPSGHSRRTKEEKNPTCYNPDSLMVHINNMKIEDRDNFLDPLAC